MSLKKKLIVSTSWNFVSIIYSRILTFSVTIILAKLLLPEDFGLVTYSLLITGTISIFRELGLSRSLIYSKGNDRLLGNTAFWLILAWSGFLYLVIVLISPIVAKFFQEKILTVILPLSGLSLLILSVTDVPLALYEKRLDFKKRIIPEVIKVTSYTITTLVLAFNEYGFWSLIWGNLVSDLCHAASTLLILKWYPTFLFSKKAAHQLLSYGKNIIGMGVSSFFIGHIDDAFVGKVLNTSSLGQYNFAFRIGNLVSKNLSHIFGRVLFPVYNKISHSKQELSHAFEKIFRQINIFSIPLSIGLIVFAPDLIRIFYDHKWDAAILPLQILSVQGIIRGFGIPIGSVFLSVGKPNISFKITVAQFLLILLIIYPFISAWQIVGVCFVKVIGSLFTIIAHYTLIRQDIDIKFWFLLRKTLSVLLISVILAFGIYLIPIHHSSLLIVFIKGFLYTIFVYILLFFFHQETRIIVTDIVKHIKTKLA